MCEHVNLAGLEPHDMENADARVKAIGYELRPQKIRPSVQSFDASGSGPMHYQCEQEKPYYILSNMFELAFAGNDGKETEAPDLEPGDFVIVPSDEVRQLRYAETGEVFVVGASNVKGDGVVVG